MVPASPDPAPAAETPDWSRRLDLILGLATPGILVVLLAEGQERVGELVARIEATGPVQVLFEAPALLRVPPGSRVVLVLDPERDATWLNLHRPVVVQRRLCVMLHCSPSQWLHLKRRAPDFADQVSHRIELPPGPPPFLARALSRAERAGGAVVVLHPGLPPAPWIAVGARDGFRSLRQAATAGPLWVNGIEDGHDWLTAHLARAAGPHGLALVGPGVCGDEEQVSGRVADWAAAAAALRGAGAEPAGREAARRELDPQAVGLPVERPVPLESDPRWARLLTAPSPPGVEDILRAWELGLVEVAQTWTEEAAGAAQEQVRAGMAGARRRGEAARVRRLEPLWRSFAPVVEAREARRVEEALGLLTGQVLPVARRLGEPWGLAWVAVEEARLRELAGDLDSAKRALRSAQEGFERVGADEELAWVQTWTGRILVMRGELDAGLGELERARAGFERRGDVIGQAVAEREIAHILVDRGRHDDALGLYERVLSGFERGGDARGRAFVLGDIARILSARGRVEEARGMHEERLRILERLGDERSRAVALGDIGRILSDGGRDNEALERFREARRVFLELGDGRNEAIVSADIARALRRSGRAEEARPLLQRRLDLFERLGDVREQANAQSDLAWAALAEGRVREAADLLREALSVYERIGDPRSTAVTLSGLARTLLVMGQPEQALTLMRQALQIFERLGDLREAAIAHHGIALVHLQRSERGPALEHLGPAWDQVVALDSLDGIAEVGHTLGRLLAECGDPRASAVLSRAWQAATRLGQAEREAALDRLISTLPP